jgi:hypothetical protein
MIKQNNEIFENYKNTYKPNIIIDNELYFKVLNAYLLFFVQKLLEGNRIKLPCHLGSMAFVGKKTKPRIDENGYIKGIPVNWGETNKLWKRNPEAKANKALVFYTNEHSDGYVYKLYWSYKQSLGTFKLLYLFTPSWNLKKKFTSFFLTGNYNYEHK